MRNLRFSALAALAVVACASPEGADQDAAGVITAEAMRAHVEFLAHDLLEGRGTGSRGHEIAAHYVAGTFRRLGLEPGGAEGTYMAPVRLRRSTIDPARSSAAILRDGRVEPLVVFDDIFLGGPSDGGSIEASAVFVGWGITAPAFDYDDYDGVDVAGKIVVLLYGAPPSIGGDAAAHYSSPSVKRRIAGEHGAVGMIVIPTDALLRLAPWEVISVINRRPGTGALDAAGNPLGGVASIRGGGLVSPSATPRLFAAAPLTWDEVREAAAAGTPGSFDLGIRLRLTVAARHEDFTSPNVIGVLHGSDPELRDEYVVVTAHLDHEGIGPPVEGDSIYNGALDNAAGVAALLETAAALRHGARPRRSILFLATTAEEMGLLGAQAFVEEPTVPIDAIVANVNLDGNQLLFRFRDIIMLGSEHSTLAAHADAAAARAGLERTDDPMPEQNFFVRSDHYPFVTKGIPAVFVMGGLTSVDSTTNGMEVMKRWEETAYHRPSDDASQDFDYAAGVDYARAAFFLVREIANSGERPAWKPDNFFGETFGRSGGT